MANASAKNTKAADDDDQSMEEILQSIKRIIAEEGEDTSMASKAGKGSDVLELTDVVREDGSVTKATPKPDAAPASAAAPAMTMPEVSQASPAADPFDALLSQEAANASQERLKSLMSQAAKPAPQGFVPVSLESMAFRSGNTVEDLVMEALRPMLKQWLDANLPQLVERMVEREIRKISPV